MTPTPLPDPADPALFLAHGRQIAAPHNGAVQPLPPARTLPEWVVSNASRIAPALVTTTAWVLARAWYLEAGGSLEPLLIGGALTALTGTAAIIAATRRVDSAVSSVAFAASGTFAVVGLAAWTPHWSLSVLLWLIVTAGIYALCVPAWRRDRRDERARAHELVMQVSRADGQLRMTTVEAAARVEIARVEATGHQAAVEAIIAASAARTDRAIAPGDELSVEALLRAAGHAPAQPRALDRRTEPS
ncbi:hypothetical protein [Streptomyces sp. G-5]|uniref:hypothetical protein n=1 Tax=Streptomyces sp. G-5 TaxID=2977231 RepID=UPI0021D1B427|nr:hypothetical protein [Streptomyces sp. G-5]MCU4750293.1 hypothetical protein [Streptomyces sp. G-5]